MAPKQRRFLAINYWVGTPTSGALVGPVLVSTFDYRHFHFWDELDAATLDLGDYEILTIYPLGWSFNEVQSGFVRQFQPDVAAERMLLDPAAPALHWAGLGQRCGQACLAA